MAVRRRIRKVSVGNYKLDLSNPLARGLNFSLIPGVSPDFRDLVGNRIPVRNGSPRLIQTPLGIGLDPNAGSLAYSIPPTGIFSMEALAYVGATVGTLANWDDSSDALSGTVDHVLGIVAGTAWEAFIYDGAFKELTVDGLVAPGDGSLHHVVATADGTTLRLYLDGASIGSMPAGLAQVSAYATPYLIIGDGSWLGKWSGAILLVNTATVAWTAAEVAARAANPFAILRTPVTRRVAGVALTVAPATQALAITGFAPTIVAAGSVAPAAGHITVTGFAPTVVAAVAVAPATGAIAITGFAPRVDRAVAPSAGAVVLTGRVPTLSAVAGAVTPGIGALSLTGYAPIALVGPAPIVPGAIAATAVIAQGTIGDAPDFLSRLRAVLPHGWFPDSAPILDGLLSGGAAAWATCYDLLTYVRLQTRIATATGVFLDLMAVDYFAGRLTRFVNESDPRFSARIRANLLPERGTRAGVIAAVTALVGEAPTIFEPANTGDTGAWGGGYATVWSGMAYGQAGAYGSLALPFQAFVTAARAHISGVPKAAGYGSPSGGYGVGAIEWITRDMLTGVVPDDVIFQTIADSAPAGTIMWVRLGSVVAGHIVIPNGGQWDSFAWDSGVVWQ